MMREHGHLLDKPECDHDSASGIDQTPLNDPSKVWECDSCGWRFVGRTAAMNPAKRCDRCKTEVSWGRDCTRNGEPAFLGGSCGCVERWLQQRELWEFEVTGVVSGIRSNVLRAKP